MSWFSAFRFGEFLDIFGQARRVQTVTTPQPAPWDSLIATLKADAALIGIVGVTAVAFGLSAFGHRNGD